MRSPLVHPIESRDGTLSKDEVLRNFMVDPIQPSKIQKRPAMWKSNLFAPAGQGFGAFDFNGAVYVWTDTGYASGTIDESIMSRSFVYLGGSSYAVLPDNPYDPGDTVTIGGTSYIVDSVDGDEITVSLNTGSFYGLSNDGSGTVHAVYWVGGSIVQLPSTGSAVSSVRGVNLAGIKFGQSNNRAAVWEADDSVIDVSGGVMSRILSSSDDGSVKVGLYRSSGAMKAAMWNGSNALTVLSVPAGWTLTAIAGCSRNGAYIVATHHSTDVAGYYYYSGTPIQLPSYGSGLYSTVYGVNDSNVKVGGCQLVTHGDYYPCYWTSGNSLTMLSITERGIAQFITNSGYVAGYYTVTDPIYGNLYRPCYWVSGIRYDLPMLQEGVMPDPNGQVYWISEDGTAKVGACDTTSGGYKPCYWDNLDQIHELPLLTGGDTGYAYSKG